MPDKIDQRAALCQNDRFQASLDARLITLRLGIANRPHILEKGAHCGADAVILDLEDVDRSSRAERLNAERQTGKATGITGKNGHPSDAGQADQCRFFAKGG